MSKAACVAITLANCTGSAGQVQYLIPALAVAIILFIVQDSPSHQPPMMLMSMNSLRGTWVMVLPLALAEVIKCASPDLLNNPGPRLALRQLGAGITSCEAWTKIYDPCTSATPGFEFLAVSVEASCLCYSSGLWQPSVYDNAWATCLSYLSTANTVVYSALGGSSLTTDVCQKAGDVIATGVSSGEPTSVPSITPPPTTISPDPSMNTAACLSFRIIEESCMLATTSFTYLPFMEEVSCLCYTNGVYAPSVYDGYWAGCLGYYSTASSAFYWSLGGDTLPRSPCAVFGDVRATGSSSTSTQSSTISMTTTVGPTMTPNPSALTTAVTITVVQPNAAVLTSRPGYSFWITMLVWCLWKLLSYDE